MAMAKFKAKIILNNAAIKGLEDAVAPALVKTVHALQTEVIQAQVVPKDVGTLESNLGVETKNAKRGRVSLVHTGAYTRRLYFHPEYNFRKTDNVNAKGQWFEDWLPGGSQEDFAAKAFAKFYKQYSGV